MRFHHLLVAAFLAAPALAASELKVEVYEGPTECADEDRVTEGNYLKMHYTGKIDESSETGEKGAQFDTSHGRGQTFDFAVGKGRVIKGWDQGLIGLCKGAKANIVIPPEFGYGASGAGQSIPGGATLHFDVEVVDILTDEPEAVPLEEPNLFVTLDTDKDGKLSEAEVEVYFTKLGQPGIPEGLWEREDEDKDGFVSWEEFSGPKGNEAPEL